MRKFHESKKVLAIFPIAVLAIFALPAIQPVFAQSTSAPLVNITAHVVHDEDAMVCGYWALDHYNKQIKIYSTSTPGDYLVYETYEGSWQTFQGALSPNPSTPCSISSLPLEGTTASGTFQGYYTYVISGTFSPSEPTHGFLPCPTTTPPGVPVATCSGTAFDYGGSSTDIMNLVFSAQKGDANAIQISGWYYFGPGWSQTFTFPSLTCNGATGFAFDFVYHYQGQTMETSCSGVTGNIVT